MKTTPAILAVLSALLFFRIPAVQAGTVVNFGTISQISGPGDPNLDLKGEMAYAINFSANDPAMFVNGVKFTPDTALPGLTVGPNQVAPWQTKPIFGSGIDADNLEEIYQDIRFALPASGQALEAHLPVTPGETYKLQVLVYGNHDTDDRRWDIEVEGVMTVDEFTAMGAATAPGPGGLPPYSPTAGIVYSYMVTVADSTFDVRMGNFGGGNDAGDRNAIWQGLTLEHIVPDADADGLPDAYESATFGGTAAQAGSGDADGDGLSNQYEYQLGTNPTVADTDGDGLPDGIEYFGLRTNPLLVDSDGDTLPDGAEDSDLDGLTNAAEINTHHTDPSDQDSDDDDYTDGVEVANGTNPLNAASYPLLSTQVRSFSGGDPGEGLDLTGTFFAAARFGLNTLAGAWPVRDANFIPYHAVPGLTQNAVNQIDAWTNMVFPGPLTTNDTNLATVMRSIRYQGTTFTIALSGLTPGRPYKLQLMFAENCCPSRGFDVYVEDTLVADEFSPPAVQGGASANPTRGAVVVYGFIAGDSTLNIRLDKTTVTTPALNDPNPILNAMTVEELSGADADGDGLDDLWENANFGNLGQTAAGDFESDGLTNLEEMNQGTDPKDADSDDDGLSDGAEVHTHHTDPKKMDTDGDGLSDQFEVVTSHTNPLLADSDGDGYPDNTELSQGTSATNPAQYPLISTIVSSFTGGDPGEGLDFTGTFPFAFNIGTPGAAPGPVGDAVFTADSAPGVIVNAVNEIPNWHAPDYGSTDNDNNLEFVMQSIRWSGAPVHPTVDVVGLTAGKVYKVQLLFAEQCCAGRAFDIEVEGVRRVDEFNPAAVHLGAGNTGRGAVVTIGLVAGDDTLNIVLNGQSVFNPAFIDHNPIISGVTIEELTLADSDGDLLADAWEMQYFGNLTAASANNDNDNDGQLNSTEFLANTNPNDSDSDNDGLSDGIEDVLGTNPLIADTDGDGLPDGAETARGTNPLLADTDGDGYPDCAEIVGGSNPLLADSTPQQATIGVFTGGDAGEGLDLDGTFLYAFNFGTPGAIGQARDANFTADNAPGIGYSALNNIPDWHAPAYGDSAADNVLEGVMQSIRWAGAPDTVRLQLPGLEVGKRYKLQLLFAETGTGRGFDVMVEGGVVADDFFPGQIMGNTNTQGCVVSYEFTAHDSVLQVELNGNGTPGAPDKNPTLSGVTLEALPPPAALAITGVSLTGAGLTINAVGNPGASYSVDYSPNLVTWEEVWDSLVPDGAGQATWTDTDPLRVGPAIKRGFYKLRDPLVDPTP